MLGRNRAAREQPAPAPEGPARILVVNDNEGACELEYRLLANAGHQVERASNAMQVASLLTLLRPACVVLDLAAGGIGRNLEILDAIRGQVDPALAATRVVLIAHQSSNRMFSWKAGTDAFLVRPFHADELTKSVAEVLARPELERMNVRRREVDAAMSADRQLEL